MIFSQGMGYVAIAFLCCAVQSMQSAMIPQSDFSGCESDRAFDVALGHSRSTLDEPEDCDDAEDFHSMITDLLCDELELPNFFESLLPLCGTLDLTPAKEGESGDDKCTKKERSLALKDMRVGDRARVKKLLNTLCEGSITFEDVQSSHYSGLTRKQFQSDILGLMCCGSDIREVRRECYQCFGKLHNIVMPSENVAIAMFHQLCPKPMTLFDLKFQLYVKNYRACTPALLGILEMALGVGEVHPHDRCVISSTGKNITEVIKKIWKDVQDLSDDGFDTYLKDAKEHDEYLQQPRYRSVLRYLRELKQCGVLAKLQTLKKEQPPSLDACAGAQLLQGTPNVDRLDRVKTILTERIDQEVSLDDLLEMTTFPGEKKGKKAVLTRAVLAVALNGNPIIYDKDNQKVRLLRAQTPRGQPAPNQNLLTVVYDLVKKYRMNLMDIEVGYYADRGGYWPQDMGRRAFFRLFNWYRVVLAVMGYTDVFCCLRTAHDAVVRQKAIWPVVKEEDTKKSLDYYKKIHKDVTMRDVDDVFEIKAWQKNPIFIAFLKYIEEPAPPYIGVVERCAHIVEQNLRQYSIKQGDFWDLCVSCGMQSVQEMWEVAGVLTQRTSEGRLIYEPQSSEFHWDHSSCPVPSEDALIASIFVLLYDIPNITNDVLMHMLKQGGFRVGLGDVFEILHGLAVLGMCDRSEKFLTKERETVDLLLTQGTKVTFDTDQVEYRIAHMVVCWAYNGSLVKLWQAYERKVQENPPSCKYQKLPGMSCRPENMIHSQMPHLDAFLKNMLSYT